MASQRDVKNRIGSVKNIQKITRAMEMVAAARLRRAEQRITALRPYADALRRMTRQAALDAGAEVSRLELLGERETISSVGLLLVTGDRGLAGGFNSQVIRAGVRAGTELDEQGLGTVWYATGRRGVSSLTFRGRELSGAYVGFTDKPSYADAREIAGELIEAYTTGAVDRVELIYNSYVSPLTQEVTRETLLPLSRATITGEEERDGGGESESGAGTGSTSGSASGPRAVSVSGSRSSSAPGPRALVEYEPSAEEILRRLVPDYVETSIYRALVESAAGFFGAQMTAMRNASENAGEIITDLTLEMNRARQAEITQEIMEVVAGAEGLS
jgi:F-type H+-transporting ATPase subunit gamma